MWFKRSKEIKKLKERNKELLDYYEGFLKDKELEIEILQKENKKLIEDFTKNYHYVLTIGKDSPRLHLYQDGEEINKILRVIFRAESDSTPYFDIEVN